MNTRQAKTTIAGCYAIWCLIHDPSTRVLIISAGTTMAKEISTWCIQILNGMPELEVLRCDKSHHGARASVEAYDVHWMLKGSDKSPSIKCMGITSSLQGSRADLLIPDDIESAKNSLTQLMREQLNHLTKDFSSINSKGKILYLGTPQSIDSVYNDLPSRDFDVRIWPGRYPNETDQKDIYGEALAPSLVHNLVGNDALRTGGGPEGDMGQPTDPGMMSEYLLTKKQLDQGKAYFNLQFMLNTALMDIDKYPLKLKDLMFHDMNNDQCPGQFWWGNDPGLHIRWPSGISLPKERIYRAAKVHEEFFEYSTRLMAIDPAGGGQNGDETGVVVLYECNGYLLLRYQTGFPGGTSPGVLADIVALAKEYKCNEILVEKNFGFGSYTEAVRSACLNAEYRCDISEIFVTGQKEKRVCDILEPIIGAHKLVVDPRCVDHDVTSTQKYPMNSRGYYQLFFQIAKMTRDSGSLIHDD